MGTGSLGAGAAPSTTTVSLMTFSTSTVSLTTFSTTLGWQAASTLPAAIPTTALRKNSLRLYSLAMSPDLPGGARLSLRRWRSLQQNGTCHTGAILEEEWGAAGAL